MFSLSIAFGSGSGIIVWGFMFKTQEAADAAVALLNSRNMGPVTIGDSFGQTGTVGREHIQGFMLEDMAQTKLAHVERNLHEMRTKIAANSAAQADPVIKFAMTQQGPAMLSPGPNGRF